MTAWGFRDEMGLPSGGLPREYFAHERSQSSGAVPALHSSEELGMKRTRKKWTQEETQMLVDGCNAHGVGNWKAILSDPKLTFESGRTPVDLKDRFRTYFPDAYRQHYPNAKTHLSDKIRSALPNGGSLFEKTRTKRRRPFSSEEDDALRRGYEKHGTLWAQIAQDPVFQSQQRRSTDLRDRFRNAFPDLYEAAGYKPRTPSKKVAGSVRSVDSSAKQDHARSRAARRRLTYPGMLQGGNATPASDCVDYSSADEDTHPHAMDTVQTSCASSSRIQLARNVSAASAVSDPSQRDLDFPRAPPRRSTSPLPDHDSISLSSQSYLLSGPASPSSPRHRILPPDTVSRDDDEAKVAWSSLNWLAQDSQRLNAHAPLTASSLFSANMFGSFASSPHDVLDRYDLYSSPLSSSANTFGDYVSEMGPGGSFSEADMDLNAFAGPASSMGFTHHSQVAGDLIFASHHGGHLQHGHGFSLYDQNRMPYAAVGAAPDPLAHVADSTLGLSNVPFTPDPTPSDSRAPYDPLPLDPALNPDAIPLALLNQTGHDLAGLADAFTPSFTVSPAELSRDPSAQLGAEATAASLAPSQLAPARPSSQPHPLSSFISADTTARGTNPVHGSMPNLARRPSPAMHLRSTSQPPMEQRLLDVRRNPLPSFTTTLSPPTATRDDLMQDLWHRSPESYQLPFLDLHYYGVADSHPSSSSPGRAADTH